MAEAAISRLGLRTLVVASGLICATAHAQKIGTYGGQLASGLPISITVSHFRGKTSVSFVQTEVDTSCRRGVNINESIFYGGLLGSVGQGVGSVSLNTGAEYLGMSLSFDDATRSVSGFIQQRFASLAPGTGNPTLSIVCTIKNEGFAAVLGNKAALNPSLRVVSGGSGQ